MDKAIDVMMFGGAFVCPSGRDVSVITEMGPWHSVSTWSGAIWHLLMAGFCCMFMLGCGSAEIVSPEIAEQASSLSSSYEKAIDAHTTTIATALAAQKLTGEMTLENTQAIMKKLSTLEASLAKSEPQNGKDGDQASAPNPPAKANTALAPLKVATPGDSSRIASDGTVLKWNIEGNWNPTILETSAHLAKEHGIDTNGMTHQEMADIHAALHDGKTEEQAVSGAMFQSNRSSAITSKRYTFRPLSRGSSAVSWQGNSTQQSCPSGRCPVRRSR